MTFLKRLLRHSPCASTVAITIANLGFGGPTDCFVKCRVERLEAGASHLHTLPFLYLLFDWRRERSMETPKTTKADFCIEPNLQHFLLHLTSELNLRASRAFLLLAAQ
jgi:hypothetical protein